MVPSLQRIGAPHNTYVTVAKTLSHMKHKVRTAHGVSAKFIQAPLNELWSGVGQGGAASGPVWLVMELPILTAMKQFSPGIKFMGPSTEPKFSATAIGYIDDNNIINTYSHSTPSLQIQHELQNTLNGWAGLLSATGGALSSSKYSTSSWMWIWKQGLLEICDQQTNIICHQTNINIPHVPCQKAIKYLGITCDTLCSYQEEMKIRVGEARHFATKLAASKLHLYEARISYEAMWESKIRYFALVVTLTQNDWSTLQKPVITALLPKLRLNRHLPRAIVYAPKCLRGIGICPYYVLHGFECIKYMIKQI